MRHRPSRLLSGLSVVALLTGSLFEPSAAMLRDGAVHHESPASAAAHGVATAGDHGHEDVQHVPRDHGHGPQHQHGTAADHCTHVHGFALVGVRQPVAAVARPALLAESPSFPSARYLDHPHHPPRA
jgi:hypothetical protein